MSDIPKKITVSLGAVNIGVIEIGDECGRRVCALNSLDYHGRIKDILPTANAIVDAYNTREGETVEEIYKRAFIDGLRAYAHWNNGVQEVGTTGKTLKQAIEQVSQTWNYNPKKGG